MEDHPFRKRLAQNAVKRLKEDGVMLYKEIAEASGVDYKSLRTFVHNCNLGPEQTQLLYNWLEDHGHIKPNMAVAETPTSYGADVLDEMLQGIMLMLRNLKHPTRERPKKARIALKQLEVIHSELGPELHELGKEG